MGRFISCVVLTLVLSASNARAQASSDTSADLELAELALAEGRIEDARAHFTRMGALVPDARATAGLGLCALEENDAVSAYLLLGRALASRSDPLEGDARARATEALRRATARVGRVHLVPAPRGATVLIGGYEPLVHEGVMLVPSGTYSILVDVPGFEIWQDEIAIEAGRETRVRLRLERARPSQGVVGTLASGTTEEDIRWHNEQSRRASVLNRAGPRVIANAHRATIAGDTPAPFVRSVIGGSLRQFEACAWPERYGSTNGVITLGFVIDAGGRTSGVEVVAATVHLVGVDACFQRVVRSLRFPAEAGRAEVRVQVPISFEFHRN